LSRIAQASTKAGSVLHRLGQYYVQDADIVAVDIMDGTMLCGTQLKVKAPLTSL
jgi:hypothetical protein